MRPQRARQAESRGCGRTGTSWRKEGDKRVGVEETQRDRERGKEGKGGMCALSLSLSECVYMCASMAL